MPQIEEPGRVQSLGTYWKWKLLSCVWLFMTAWAYSPGNSPGHRILRATRVGNLSLLQGIFPTQGLNPGLSHRRRILYQLSHKGSPGNTCLSKVKTLSCCCLVAQSCPTLCNPMDCSPPDSSVHGVFQARILEWVVISFSRGSSQPKDRIWVFYVSSIGMQVLYHSATREAHITLYGFTIIHHSWH